MNSIFRLLKNEIQNFATSNSVISVGIHKPGFDAELKKAYKTKDWRKRNE